MPYPLHLFGKALNIALSTRAFRKNVLMGNGQYLQYYVILT